MSFRYKKSLLKLAFAGVCLALCLLLPFLTANSQTLGNLLCLMHIPVLLCGFICGWQYGLAVGATAPLLRNLLFGMPPFPTVAVPMMAELAVYGLLTGLIYRILPRKMGYVYLNLILSLTAGRIVSVLTKYALYALGQTQFSLSMVLKMNFITTLPGVGLQLVLIPTILFALKKGGVLRRDK